MSLTAAGLTIGDMPEHALEVDQLQIVYYPDPILRQKSQPISAVDPTVQAVAERMIELMNEARGVGLAAPQVGLGWRMFVANPTGEPDHDRVYINPVLTAPARQTAVHEEGCLSIPNVNADITRPTAITLEALDIDGRPFTETAQDLAARVWQHEYDHLEGILILDRMTPIDRQANQRILRDLEGR